MTTLIAAVVLFNPIQAEYKPTGPKIRFTMASKKSFVITTDPKASPKTVEHILGLVKKGFYDRQRVHRVEHWVTQWGAPASKDQAMDIKGPDGKMMQNPAVGDGGSGKDVPFEMSEVDFRRGVVGVASTGLQVGGDSQLFILKKDWERLYHSYAVVGLVTEGMEIVDSIKRGDRFMSAKIVR